jgi:hypothetical protein
VKPINQQIAPQQLRGRRGAPFPAARSRDQRNEHGHAARGREEILHGEAKRRVR